MIILSDRSSLIARSPAKAEASHRSTVAYKAPAQSITISGRTREPPAKVWPLKTSTMRDRKVSGGMCCFLLLAVLAGISGVPPGSEQDCPFGFWRAYGGDQLMRHPTADAYLFVTDHLRIDADGAPNAYHPDDEPGLDALANAGYPDSPWWSDVLVPDPEDPRVAYVQSSGAFSGYFVSQTALQATAPSVTDPGRYVDATRVPYLVFPSGFAREEGTGRLGDLGFALNVATGESSPFIVADIGPADAQLGEISIALAERLGGSDVNPRTGAGAPRGDMLYLIFRFSSASDSTARWPLSPEQMQSRVDELLAGVGGREIVSACGAPSRPMSNH